MTLSDSHRKMMQCCIESVESADKSKIFWLVLGVGRVRPMLSELVGDTVNTSTSVDLKEVGSNVTVVHPRCIVITMAR